VGNNNKMIENDVQKIWVKNEVILVDFHFWQVFMLGSCTFASFRIR